MRTVGFAGVPRNHRTTAQLLESSMTELFYLRYITGIGNYTALLQGWKCAAKEMGGRQPSCWDCPCYLERRLGTIRYAMLYPGTSCLPK